MELKKEFIVAIEKRFQCSLTESMINEQLKNLAFEQNDNSSHAFLLGLSCLTTIENNQHVITKIESLLGVSLPILGEITSEDVINHSLDSKKSTSIVISIWLRYSFSDTLTALLVIALANETNEERKAFLKEVWNFNFSLLNSSSAIEKLCDCFHSIAEKITDGQRAVKFSKVLISKIDEIEVGKQNAILALYWYYAYLGEKSIVELLKTSIEKLQIENLHNFIWPWYDNKFIIQRHEKIKLTMNTVIPGRSNLIDGLRSKIERVSLRSLIPSILYAHTIGDIEIESWLLKFAWKKRNTTGVITRFGELSGYSVPKQVLNVVHADRGSWISNHLNKCTLVSAKGFANQKEISAIKEVYTIQPFNVAVIHSLIVINSIVPNDKDIEKMLANSITKITSCINLGKMLTKALQSSAMYVVQLVLESIFKQRFYETILYSIKEVNFRQAKKKSITFELIILCLQFYEQFTPEGKKHHKRLKSLKDNYKQVSYGSISYSKRIESIARNISQNQYLGLLSEKKKYDELFLMLLEKDLSVDIVENILQLAVKLQSPVRILDAYKLLVSLSPERASFYNMEVEAFLIVQNKYIKAQSTSNSLVSTIWGIPGNFGQPVNRQTAKFLSKN